MEEIRVEKQIGNETLSITTGFLAKQAHGAVLVQYGETVVLVATVSGPSRPGTDFFPLTCDYRERTAAAGKFPGGFIKREGRPTTKEILSSRLMDRPIRPMFPKGYYDEVQIQANVVASDRQHDGDVLAMLGASAALCISHLPFQGPLSAVRIGRVDGELVPFPTFDQLEQSDLDLIISGSKDSVLMIEGFSREIPEDEMADAIMKAHEIVKSLCDLQLELIEKVGPQKMEFEEPNDGGLYQRLMDGYYADLKAAKQTTGKQDRADKVRELKTKVKEELIPDPAAEDAICENLFGTVWHDLEERVVRDLILSGTRTDGRDTKTLRPILCKVDVLPRVHGSAVFQRGETQSLITVTLGTPRDEQRVDGLIDEYSKKFMLDYNFPSFSVGECRPIRGPGRREIGHGALAERSVNPILPNPEDFPYTIRVISDILESNGSSSMASVCGATLGLMAAGVPITNPVAGISIGLVKEGDDFVLLTDILGEEDHHGDMDFKVAGTQNGITGIQLDLKIKGINEEIIRKTLVQAREARIEILRKMLTTISQPKDDTSVWAPRMLRTKINPEKIGLLIGPGGKTIRAIQEETGATIDVDDDGSVIVASGNLEWAEAAMARVQAITGEVEVGKIYEGRVTSVKDFGAFVEILPGRDGLCHISELSNEYVSDVNSVVKVGDILAVKVLLVDEHDRVKLSHKATLPGGDAPAGEGDEELETAGSRGGDRGDRGGRGGDRRGGGDRGGRGGDRGGRPRRPRRED
ncbi:polyribonucleotide nucleotidyltransferase [Bremerella cremea]|uniref:Polyribonucleotide nucleotidyltransferase n=1 Tax=Blastopirellula marina TaxID=124 RepID=A0A2S8FR74_9BACT|nr:MULTISPECIES: polyribonucleotide nucleotidyltransferase [Pirellulaceae]PQO34678.1 polyribonucleotide nucleotidyltransferase [Blastopirellula marina]RCS47176.1 polyribonucleotide nucleotidyltransferase [Bremerella cremea]